MGSGAPIATAPPPESAMARLWSTGMAIRAGWILVWTGAFHSKSGLSGGWAVRRLLVNPWRQGRAYFLATCSPQYEAADEDRIRYLWRCACPYLVDLSPVNCLQYWPMVAWEPISPGGGCCRLPENSGSGEVVEGMRANHKLLTQLNRELDREVKQIKRDYPFHPLGNAFVLWCDLRDDFAVWQGYPSFRFFVLQLSATQGLNLILGSQPAQRTTAAVEQSKTMRRQRGTRD